MSRRMAWSLLLLLLAMLIVGTQMPGAWRDGIEHRLRTPFSLSSWAHFVLFGAIAMVLSLRPFALPPVRVLLIALGLALLTEGLQRIAVDRHPRISDVIIDMAGTVLALSLAKQILRYQSVR
jgi:VanZ family protein